MPRKSREIDEYQRPSKSGSRRPAGWFKRVLIVTIGVVLLATGLAPRFLLGPGLVGRLVNQLGGLQPLEVRMGDFSMGWLSPAAISDLRLVDASGNELLVVDRIATSKGIIGWLRNRQDLGVIQIDGVKASIQADQGSTNIEQALAEFLKGSSDQQADQEQSSAVAFQGTISLTNAQLQLSQPGRPERWSVQIPTLQAKLPDANQLIGPIEMKAVVTELSGTQGEISGEILAKAEQKADGAVELKAKLENLSLDIWHIIGARLPDIPIQAMTGIASGTLAGNAVNIDQWTFDLQQVQVQNFAISAPELIGTEPAQLNQIVAGGRISLANQVMQLQDTQLACDVGQLQAAAAIPWPLKMPTLTEPFQSGAKLQAAGSIDLPRLAHAARTLLPVREDTQLIAGQMQFSANHQTQQDKQSQLQVTFTGLQANAAGQQISWQEPLTVRLSANQPQRATQFDVAAIAEFCNVQGNGTLENGSLNGDVNLDLLHKRLSQFVDLPVSTMSGAAKVGMKWAMDSQQRVEASGQLETSPLVIATSAGGQMREPSWNGHFSANAQLRDGSPQQINQLKLQLKAENEQLTLDLFEPLSFSATGQSVATPAAFQLALSGDLAGWKRRGLVWLSQPPDVDASGKIQLAVSGKIDLAHVEVLQANWDAEPVHFRYADLAMSEPKMVGNFKGRVDTNDLTRLQVDQLTVQATSFWVVAQDQAATGQAPGPSGSGRSGQANFMFDLHRLMNNLANTPSTIASNADTQSQLSALGTVQGNLQWLIGSAGADFALKAKGEKLILQSMTPQAQAAQPLWAEPTLDAAIVGKWQSENSSVDLSDMQLQTEWLNYRGNLTYRTSPEMQNVAMKGQAVYNAAGLAAKLGPMTGNSLQMTGQQSVPVDAQWQRAANAAENLPMLAGLKASTRLGWEQARVVGIELGKADVPVTIDAGLLTTAAEIPVSGGMLRWDLTGDLTSDLLVIQQKPMVVLENVAITQEMCSGWLKYVAPLLAEATSIDGRLSLSIDQAELTPTDLSRQTVAGTLVMHQAEVGPGPLTNEITGLIRQIEAIRKADPGQTVSSQNRVWMQLPEQRIAFRMVEGRVHHRDLNIALGDARLSTSGSVDVAGNLEIMTSLPIPDNWTQKGPVLAALRGQTLQFPMNGTIYRPQIDASTLGQLGRQTIQNAAQGMLQQGLNKGLEKLFK